METGPAGRTLVQAVRHPSTAAALRRLGASLPLTAFALRVSVADGVLVVSDRSRRPVLAVEASRIRAIGIGEVGSRPPMPVTALAILVTVDRPDRDVVLPIVPVDDRGRAMTWRDSEVRALADRLRHALALA